MSRSILILANNDGGLYHFRKELLEEFVKKGNTVYCALPFGEQIENIIKIIENL